MVELTEFEQSVLEAIKDIPTGYISTYKIIAKKLGRPRAARAVGNALNKNPHLLLVPCHRVIKSDGSVGGYAAGERKKMDYLRQEGLIIEDGKVKDFKKALADFNLS